MLKAVYMCILDSLTALYAASSHAVIWNFCLNKKTDYRLWIDIVDNQKLP